MASSMWRAVRSTGRFVIRLWTEVPGSGMVESVVGSTYRGIMRVIRGSTGLELCQDGGSNVVPQECECGYCRMVRS